MPSTFGFMGLGASELVLVLALVLLFFGGRKLPELSRSLGNSMRELRKGLNSDAQDEKTAKDKSGETAS
jgi:sec-independent protein translocase protein TatA